MQKSSLANNLSDRRILILVNVDGIQLFKNSENNLWTISFYIPCILQCPIICGAFYGKGKPDHKKFLSSFVNELKIILSTRMINIHFATLKIDQLLFVCDAPARSFLKQTKNHTGYFSCERCAIEGTYANDRVVFDEMNSTLRTNGSFRQRFNEEHHVGTSLLEDLPIDMVSDFTLDTMHLMCLGVCRRLVLWWISNGPPSCRIPSRIQGQISEKLCSFKVFFSRSFSRKPRSLFEVRRYKATEFRVFLLYSGVCSLNGLIDESLYLSFMLLHCAMEYFIRYSI